MSQPGDPFEFLKTLWGPMGLPMAGVMAPTLDSSELEKRIAELKSVETWLNMNLSMLRMTLQTLEMQKAALAAMQGAKADPSAAAAGAPAPENPAAFIEAWWKAMQQNLASGKTEGKNEPEKK